jgi:hypothetical protein
MKLAIRPLWITCAIFGGVTALTMGLANMWWPPYGKAFLGLLASVYPGYTPNGSFGSVLNVTLYATIDLAIGGFLFGLLYNQLVRMHKNKK